MLAFVGCILVTDKEVQLAIAVEVSPGRRLRWAEGKKARTDGHVFKGAVAAIVQEAEGVLAELAPPCAAKHDEVWVAVIVVVGENGIQAANLVRQAGCLCVVAEGTVAVVMEEVHCAQRIAGAGHDVEQAVAIEVLDRRAT